MLLRQYDETEEPNMEWNTAMRFVMARAQAEAAATESSAIGTAHVFLGLLKLAELTADDISPTSRHKERLDADIAAVRPSVHLRK